MALKATIRNAVKAAFKAMDDIPKRCVYHSVSGTVVRDLDTGTSSMPATDYTLPMVVFARFTEKETDKDPGLMTTDTKLLFPSFDLPVLPKSSDTITDDAGVLWEIVKRITDPAAVVTICQARTS